MVPVISSNYYKMYINITDSATADNKGSSSGLVGYLEKENRLYHQKEPENWFNHQRANFEAYEVRQAIDQNVAKLGKADAKFFLINISPSQKEIRHLQELHGGIGAEEALKKYSEKVMDEYAKNFKRTGIESAKDLVWFAKLEHFRYYSYKDKEVISGTKKRGERKEGQQMHVQIIVSRKDATNKIKLSPMNNSKGRNALHSKKLGQFNRMAFKQSGEILFDKLFSFDRQLNETLAYANVQKHGNLQQREQLYFLEEGAKNHPRYKNVMAATARQVAQHQYHDTAEMLGALGKAVIDVLDVLLEPGYEPSLEADIVTEDARRRRRRKKAEQQQGL